MFFYSLLAALCLAATVTAQEWADSELLSAIWESCSRHDIQSLRAIVQQSPEVVFHRAADGRGPLFWAYEFADTAAIELLEALGLDPDEQTDADDKTPKQIGIENEELNKHREFPSIPNPGMNQFQNSFDIEDDPWDEDEDDEDEDEDDEL